MIEATARDTRVAWHARWVLPIESPPIRDGAVVVDGDRIAWVGPSSLAQAAKHEHLGNAILLPGLVNAHTHLELAALRGFLEGLDFREWLRVLTDVSRNVFDAQSLWDASRFGVSEALRAGITTVADCSPTGAPLSAMIDAGIRGRVYLETFGPDAAQVPDSILALQNGVRQLRERVTHLVDVGISPHAPYSVSPALFEAVARYARDEDLPVATHIAESAAEVDFVRNGAGTFADRLRLRNIVFSATNASPLELLERTGMLGPKTLCIHAIHVDSEDVRRISSSGSTVVHCPISNAKLGQGIAPVPEMLATGVVVGLGTDSVASNDRMDLLAEVRQAVLLQSLAASRPDAVSASDALELATRGSARALGMDDIGVLAPGRAADMCAFSCDAFEASPVYDPCVLLVHVLGSGREALLTMVGGRVLVRDGVELAFDSRIRERVMATGESVTAYMDSLRHTGVTSASQA